MRKKPTKTKKPTAVVMQRVVRRLADKVARELIAVGDGPTPCHRIEFKGGAYPDNEIKQGGLCESSLAKTIAASLARHWPSNVDLRQDADSGRTNVK